MAYQHPQKLAKIKKGNCKNTINEKEKTKKEGTLREEGVCLSIESETEELWQRTCWVRSHSYWVGPGGVPPRWNKLHQASPQEREKILEGKPRT